MAYIVGGRAFVDGVVLRTDKHRVRSILGEGVRVLGPGDNVSSDQKTLTQLLLMHAALCVGWFIWPSVWWNIIPQTAVFAFACFQLWRMPGVAWRHFHAAEHMVVNATRSTVHLVHYPLTLDSVCRASRLSSRCGSNFAAGFLLSYVAAALIFSGVWGASHWTSYPLFLLVVVLLSGWCDLWSRTVSYWLFGRWIQKYVTTRPATMLHLEQACAAYNKLVELHYWKSDEADAS